MGHVRSVGTSMLKPIDLPSGDHLMSEILWSTRVICDVPLGVHPTDEELRAARSAAVDVGDARSVGRPPRTAALRQKPILRAIRVHDPQLGVEAVLELVDMAARVDDLRSVRRDLRVADLLEVEEFVDGEQRVGSPFLSEERNARREQCND